MKLFNALLIAAGAQTTTYRSYKDIVAAYRNGVPYENWWISDGSRGITNPNEWRTCGEPNNPKNAQVECNGNRCTSICTPGYFTKGRFDGSVCRKDDWKTDVPDCETCKMPEIKSRPGLDSFCDVSTKSGRMTCKLQCTNGKQIYGKLERGISCKCHNTKGCNWMFTGKGMRREEKHHVDLDDLERICPRPAKPEPLPVTNTCPAAEKNPQCTNVTNKGSIQNSWTCRDCHRVRVYFNKRDYAPALNKFDNRDSLYVKLSVRVQFDKWAHPAMRPVYIGGNEYRVPFSAMKDFTDGNVDFTAEFRPLGTIEPKILSVRTCPCSHQIEPDFCDSDNDCDGVCQDEKCVECGKNGDCHNGGVCHKNICLGCEESSDCNNGQVCSDQQMCVDCDKNEDCLGDETCHKGECIECNGDADCGAGKCHNNKCVECRNNNHCMLEMRCNNQKYCM